MNKIDIITINLNNKEGLRKTIESVINQTYKDKIHYIIIDGASTDGSLDIIKQYQDKIDYWVSEKDNGIYNAFNKAIQASTSEYSLYLNSGDYLCENNIIERLYDSLDADIVYGNEWKEKNGRKTIAKYPDKLDESFFKRTALPHQSTFIKTQLLKQHPYSEEYKLLGDWMWLRERIMVDKVTYKHLPYPISVYNLNGISTTQRSVHEKEKKEYYLKKC